MSFLFGILLALWMSGAVMAQEVEPLPSSARSEAPQPHFSKDIPKCATCTSCKRSRACACAPKVKSINVRSSSYSYNYRYRRGIFRRR